MKTLLYFGLMIFLLCGCAAQTPLAQFRKLCEKTGGVYLDCAVAFAQICSEATLIDGRQVVCSCREGTVWNPDQGCR